MAAASDADDADAPVGDFRHAFRIGHRWLLIPAGMPAEVYPLLPCTRLPFTHHWCWGLASFRGDLAPVYAMAALLEAAGADTSCYLLALGRREASAALCIDEITGITVLADTPSTPLPPLPGLLSALACHGVTVDGVSYIEMALDHLLMLLAARASLIAVDSFTPENG